jgi:phosphatidylinositol 3-kinase
LTEDGCLFHVDFAFLFGADPKPFPPPMKLCKEMVEAIGDLESAEFTAFKQLCLRAFQVVRLNAGLVLDFLALHRSGCEERAEAVRFVRGRLAVEKGDQEALVEFERLILESVHAMFPQVMETIHKWAQYWRS